MIKWVYLSSEGNASMKSLLGGKGANLAEMINLGLPAPQGLTITTGARTQCYEDGRKINGKIMGQVMEYVAKMEEIIGKKSGDKENPLSVFVHSDARVSMPGMMDTILNLGLNEEIVEVLAAKSGNPCWVWDYYRRFIQMFSGVVMEAGKKYFEELINKMKGEEGVAQDVDLIADDLKELASQFKAEYKKIFSQDFLVGPREQLIETTKAVSRSWDGPRANTYCRDNDILCSQGAAVNVRMMAFGNMDNTSDTGVVFTCNPATGEKHLMGEFLVNTQGEDVVAGVRTPQKVDQLEEIMPEIYEQFVGIYHALEDHYKDMQYMEFTIKNKELYMFQTRNGKRTAKAVLEAACDLVGEGMIVENEAVAMIEPRNLDILLHPQFDAKTSKAAEPMAKTLAISPGTTCGKIVFMAENTEEQAARGEKVILVRLETSPEDIEGMKVAQGILTIRSGMTSHTAVVAHGMDTCRVPGCSKIAMDETNKRFTLVGRRLHGDDWSSLGGSTGKTYGDQIKIMGAVIAGGFGRIMGWADKYRRLKVRTNIDTPADVRKARELGAEDTGLCRTEYMLSEDDRIDTLREMTCPDTVEEGEVTLKKVLPVQQGDLGVSYGTLEDNLVTIHFLDPPLHEFIPTGEEDIRGLANSQGKTVEQIKVIVAPLHEFDPMIGRRGCRLAVTYPGIAEMQTKAIIHATISVQKQHADWKVCPEVMIPLIHNNEELRLVKNIVVETADVEIAVSGIELEYGVGAVIEIPRAYITADEIAKNAQFFYFDTNDLTQMTYGFSRDDTGEFLNTHYSIRIFENDPFTKPDRGGAGKLTEVAIKLDKGVRPDIHVGIYGGHSGDPTPVEFCHKIGLDYASCSPLRVLTTRLAAAQIALAGR